MLLFQETEVKEDIDREVEDESEDMIVREMVEKSMNMKMEATT